MSVEAFIDSEPSAVEANAEMSNNSALTEKPAESVIILKTSTMQKCLDYLTQRPYSEVFELIANILADVKSQGKN